MKIGPVIAGLATVLLVACGPIHVPQEKTYVLSSPAEVATLERSRTQKTLLVSLPTPNPGFDTNAMVYELTPYNLQFYADHQWAAPPAQMLLPVLAQLIRHQGYFKAVVATPYGGVADYYLDTRLIVLQQEFLQPMSRVHLVLQETLTDTSTNEIIASKQFVIYEEAPGNNPYSGVVAANKALQLIGAKVAEWVTQQCAAIKLKSRAQRGDSGK